MQIGPILKSASISPHKIAHCCQIIAVLPTAAPVYSAEQQQADNPLLARSAVTDDSEYGVPEERVGSSISSPALSAETVPVSTIIVEKITEPAGAAQTFNFDPSWTSDFQLADAQSITSQALPPGSYAVQELPQSGWELTSATCDDGSSPSDISLQVGETVTCSFSNTKIPVINSWYGDSQNFGQMGNPQQWVNILGTVDGLTTTDSLTYSLNGGTGQPLSIGRNIQRLVGAGDFNIEIDYADLNPGNNQVIITADDGTNQNQKTVTVNYTAGQTWPRSVDAVWNASANIQDIAQVVDGKWQIDGDSVVIDTDNWGYDRLLSIGDETWANYEATVPFRVFAIDPSGYWGVSSGPAVGIIMHWLGHTSRAGEQPNVDWDRSGAVGWYRWFQNYSQGLELRSYSSRIAADTNRGFQFGTPYILKMSVQSIPGAPDYYRLKMWDAAEAEPLDWDLQGYTSDTAAATGSLLLVAHHVDVRFGQVTIRDLDTLRLNVNVTLDGSGTIILNPDQQTFSYGERVRIAAIPAAGHEFSGWSGDYVGVDNPADFRIYRDMNITAHFAPISSVTPKSDVFSHCELDTGIWTLVNPAGDGELSFLGSAAQLMVPAGSSHNMWSSNADALRIMQPTANYNFTVEAKFEDLPAERYQMEGILIQQDAANWLRFDFYHDGLDLHANAAKNLNGSAGTIKVASVDPGSATEVFIRVERIGSSWTQSYSFNGSDWTPFVVFIHEMEVAASGVFVGNSAQTPGLEPAFTTRLDYFYNTAVPLPNAGPGSITFNKQTKPAGATDFNFDGDFGSFSLNDDASQIFTDLCSRDYLVSEINNSGWLLDHIQCDSDHVYRIDDSVTIQLDAGEQISCTFANQRIAFTVGTGWNMVSSNIEPTSPDLWDLFDPIVDDVVLVKNGAGDVFWPDQGINSIGDWAVDEGYQIFMDAPAALALSGAAVDPTRPIALPAGWSMFAYLRDEPMPVETALATISDSLVLAKDGFGNVYWPDYAVNNIGDMEPSKGYQLFLSAPETLIYPP